MAHPRSSSSPTGRVMSRLEGQPHDPARATTSVVGMQRMMVGPVVRIFGDRFAGLNGNAGGAGEYNEADNGDADPNGSVSTQHDFLSPCHQLKSLPHRESPNWRVKAAGTYAWFDSDAWSVHGESMERARILGLCITFCGFNDRFRVYRSVILPESGRLPDARGRPDSCRAPCAP